MKMETQMKATVVAVQEKRGVRKERDRLVVVPDSHSYLIELELEDGRPAYLTGAGSFPYTLGETLTNAVEG